MPKSTVATSTLSAILDSEPLWLTIADVVAIHDQQLQIYGGPTGVKDLGLVESALAAPINHRLYEENEDVLMLALVLCRAIAKNHGFVDGNKRTAFVAMVEFLEINGYELDAPDVPVQGLNGEDVPWPAYQVVLLLLDLLPIANVYANFVPYLHELP